MKNNLKELLIKFNEVNAKKWIKGVNNDVSGVGLTFEKELGKSIDSDIFPDFRDIEIKCSQRYSGFPISLFNYALDGPRVFETNYILEKYGKKYSENSSRKYLFVNLKHASKVLVNDLYYFELFLSTRNMKMYIRIYDLDENLLDTSYIELDILKEHIMLKLSKLALVYASKKQLNENNYFRYYNLKYYQMKNIDKFFQLIQRNIVKVSIACRASYSKSEKGKQKNKGLTFKIAKKDIFELFDEVLDFDADKKEIKLNSEFIFEKDAIINLGDTFEKTQHMDLLYRKE